MKFLAKNYIIFFLITLFVVFLDQYTKKIATDKLSETRIVNTYPACNSEGRIASRPKQFPAKVVPVLSWWNFRYVENCGGIFGMMRDHSQSFRRPFFLISSIIALVFISWMIIKLPQMSIFFKIGLPLILGGALGNNIDRLRLYYVVDFIEWYVKDYHWPTFNVADAAITAGVGFVILDMFFHKNTRSCKQEDKNNKEDKNNDIEDIIEENETNTLQD